jgi:hypothetical protein
MEVSDQLLVPAALTRGKGPRNPLDRRLGETLSRSARCREKSFIPTDNRTPAIQPVVISTGLFLSNGIYCTKYKIIVKQKDGEVFLQISILKVYANAYFT